jgi:hypothetical protein
MRKLLNELQEESKQEKKEGNKWAIHTSHTKKC